MEHAPSHGSADSVGTLGRHHAALASTTTRIVQGALGAVAVILVGARLSSSAQGFFYSFLSLLALFQLTEFGLSYSVMQAASHLAPHVRWSRAGRLSGDATAVSSLVLLSRAADAWLGRATVVAAISLAVVGALLVRDAAPVGEHAVWILPWLVAIFAASVWQRANARIAILEGGGRVNAVWNYRLIQESAAGAGMCIALAFGIGIWSLPLAYAIRAIHVSAWLTRWPRIRDVANLESDGAVQWRTEIWPFQWRVGLSAISGYAAMQAFAPILLASKGAAVAGQFGITLAIANGMLSATSALPNSQAPRYGSLIAQRAFRLLDREFRRTLAVGFTLSLVGVGALVALRALMGRTGLDTSGKLLPSSAFAAFMLSAALNYVTFSLAIYLRAYRREPLLISSVVLSGAFIVALMTLGRRLSSTQIAEMYLAFTMVGLLVSIVVFIASRRRWRMRDV